MANFREGDAPLDTAEIVRLIADPAVSDQEVAQRYYEYRDSRGDDVTIAEQMVLGSVFGLFRTELHTQVKWLMEKNAGPQGGS